MLKEVLKRPSIRFFLGLLVILWIAVGTQFLAQKLFFKEGSIKEAFSVSDYGSTESKIEMMASINDRYLSRQDKINLITQIADELGIRMESQPLVVMDKKREEVSYIKEAKCARTTLRCASLTDGSQYVMASIVIFNDKANDIVEFQELLENIFTNLKISKETINTTLQLCGTYDGPLLLSEKNRITDRMIATLNGEVAFENRQDDLYTVYAYTGRIKEYVVVDHTKINVQVAITYDETTDQTKVYLATPIISGDY